MNVAKFCCLTINLLDMSTYKNSHRNNKNITKMLSLLYFYQNSKLMLNLNVSSEKIKIIYKLTSYMHICKISLNAQIFICLAKHM